LIYELGNGQWQIPKLRQLLEDILPHNSVFNNFEVTHDFESVGRRTMLLNAGMLSAANQPARILLGIEDATEVLGFQAAAMENAERFKRLFERSPLPKWVFERETLRFLDVNEAAVEHYGYRREEFLRMTLLDVSTAEASESLQAALARRPHCLPERETTRHCKKSGEVMDVEVRTTGIALAGKPVWLATINDITEQRRAEEALQKAHAELQSHAEELGRFNRVAVGRELRMIELKKEVNELCRAQGQAARYSLDFEQDEKDTAG
jgi:PAS domain S-box-containing protein